MFSFIISLQKSVRYNLYAQISIILCGWIYYENVKHTSVLLSVTQSVSYSTLTIITITNNTLSLDFDYFCYRDEEDHKSPLLSVSEAASPLVCTAERSETNVPCQHSTGCLDSLLVILPHHWRCHSTMPPRCPCAAARLVGIHGCLIECDCPLTDSF